MMKRCVSPLTAWIKRGQVLFVVTIHDAQAKSQNFGQIDNAYIQVYDDQTAMSFAATTWPKNLVRLIQSRWDEYNSDSGWCFDALGQGVNGGCSPTLVCTTDNSHYSQTLFNMCFNLS